jgi:hypothetical protein
MRHPRGESMTIGARCSPRADAEKYPSSTELTLGSNSNAGSLFDEVA